MSQPISNLKDIHQGEIAWIVGKGPSLRFLEAIHFGPGPIIALNEAIIKVEQIGLNNPIYSMQKDWMIIKPKKAPMIIHDHMDEIAIAGGWFATVSDDLLKYEPKYFFDNPKDFNIDVGRYSQISALYIAKLMGCKKVVYVCCDFLVTGDLQTCLPKEDGTFIISDNPGYTYRALKEQYQEHINDVNLDVCWITPGVESAVERADKIKGWMSIPELEWLYQAAKRMDSIAELGCFRGRSTYVLCAGCPGKVYAIDCHYCGTMWPFEKEAQHTLTEFLENVGHFSNMVSFCGHFAEAAVSDLIPPEVDMVFIDGDHAYESVLLDLETWASRTLKMLCGHDLSPATPGIEKALTEFCGMEGVVRGPGSLWYIKKGE